MHGRGGQGVVTAANLLAVAAARQGLFVQAFPVFGVERRGAPVAAFLRMDRRRISIRSQIYSPDVVVVLDPTVMETLDVLSGLRKGGLLLLNTPRAPGEVAAPGARVATVDATAIALENSIGTRTNPIVNTAILGGYARAAGDILLPSVLGAVRDEAPGRPDVNARAVEQAYAATKVVR